MPDSPLTGGGESQRSLWGPDGSRLSESDAAPVDTPPDALPGAAAAAAAPPTGAVPARLAWLAGWSWRLLMIAAAVYVLFRVAEKLWLVTLPFLTALLITALLHPLVALLRTRLHLPRLLAAWLTIVLAFAVLFAVGTFVVQQMSSHYAALVDQGTVVANHIRDWLSRGPLHVHVDTSKVNTYGEDLRHYLVTHRSIAVSGVVTAGRTVTDVATGLILCFFMTFFLVYDGAQIWGWVIRLFPSRSRTRVDGAGRRVWRTLSGYVVGTFLVACFHGVVLGLTMGAVGVPLVVPLAVLVFIGSFVPIIGVIIFGGLAVLVTLVSAGPGAGLVLLVILVVANQVESHLLQPLVVGRYVQLHPLAIAVTLTAGALLAGLPGAIFGVPIVAAVNAAVLYLSGREDAEGRPQPRTELILPTWHRPHVPRRRPGGLDPTSTGTSTGAGAAGPPPRPEK